MVKVDNRAMLAIEIVKAQSLSNPAALANNVSIDKMTMSACVAADDLFKRFTELGWEMPRESELKA